MNSGTGGIDHEPPRVRATTSVAAAHTFCGTPATDRAYAFRQRIGTL